MGWTFKYKIKINCSIEQVFDKFASADGFRSWFVDDTDYQPIVGSKFTMHWKQNQTSLPVAVEVPGEVVEFTPNSVFAFKWISPENTALETIARFSFESLPDGSTVITVEDGEFLEELRYAKDLSSVSEGWASCLMTLKGVLQFGVDLRE